MIIKGMDEYAAELATLERLLLADPPEAVERALRAERSAILRALKSQRDSSFHLDFYFNDSSDWALIHDLRLEMGEQAVHIDHLLISRTLDLYVIASPHYNAGVRFDRDGLFCYYINNRPVETSSPLESNRQRIRFLEHFLEHNGLRPRRMGLSIRPTFHNVVMVAPNAKVTREGSLGARETIIQADRFFDGFCRNVQPAGLGDLVGLARYLTGDVLETFAARLAQRHIPQHVDYAGRYGLKHPLEALPEEECRDGCQCAACQRRITGRVARYCKENHELFGGRVYCFDCQKGLAFQQAAY